MLDQVPAGVGGAVVLLGELVEVEFVMTAAVYIEDGVQMQNHNANSWPPQPSSQRLFGAGVGRPSEVMLMDYPPLLTPTCWRPSPSRPTATPASLVAGFRGTVVIRVRSRMSLGYNPPTCAAWASWPVRAAQVHPTQTGGDGAQGNQAVGP